MRSRVAGIGVETERWQSQVGLEWKTEMMKVDGLVVQVFKSKKSCLELRSHFGGVSEEDKDHEIQFQNEDISVDGEIMKKHNENT